MTQYILLVKARLRQFDLKLISENTNYLFVIEDDLVGLITRIECRTSDLVGSIGSKGS